MDLSRAIIPILVLLLCGALLWIALVLVMGWSILHPPKMSAGKAIYYLGRLSPGDLGLEFEEQSFTVLDRQNGKQINLSAWWIPAHIQSEKCVVLIHGYADAKVGSIAWAPLLHSLGLNILALDLRAHGDSAGSCCTGGFFESDDVNQVIDQLLKIYPMQTKKLVLFGISLGAAVACGVAAQRVDISAVVLESPFTDYRKAIIAHTQLMHLPASLLARAAIVVAEKLSGARFDLVRPGDLLGKIQCPSLVIAGQKDPLLDAEDFLILQRNASDFWLAPDVAHLGAMGMDPVDYQRRISEFLART